MSEDLQGFLGVLRGKGYGEGEYRLVITKELKIEPVKSQLSLNDVLPYPIKRKKGLNCPICGDDYSVHSHMDYFFKPQHIRAVRDFLVLLRNKHDVTKTIYLKLGVESPQSVLNPKEMVLLLRDLVNETTSLANQFIPIITHYTPSESFKFEIQVGVARKLVAIEGRYGGLSRKWLTDFRLHKNYDPDLTYPGFVEIHEEDAEIDYFNIQSELHGVTSRILAYAKLMEEWNKAEPPLKRVVKESILRRRERASAPVYKIVSPKASEKKSNLR